MENKYSKRRFQEPLVLDLTLYDPKQSLYQEKNNTIAEAAGRIQRTAYQVLPIRYKATKIKGKLVVENGICRSNNIVVWYCRNLQSFISSEIEALKYTQQEWTQWWTIKLVMLSITAVNHKMTPGVILKCKIIPKCFFSIIVRPKRKGWMTDELMKDLIDVVCERKLHALRQLSMLVLESFREHTRPWVKANIPRSSEIPDGRTKILQP